MDAGVPGKPYSCRIPAIPLCVLHNPIDINLPSVLLSVPMDTFLSINQVAKRMGLHRNTVSRLIYHRQLEATVIGTHCIRISEPALARYIAAHSITVAPVTPVAPVPS